MRCLTLPFILLLCCIILIIGQYCNKELSFLRLTQFQKILLPFKAKGRDQGVHLANAPSKHHDAGAGFIQKQNLWYTQKIGAVAVLDRLRMDDFPDAVS